MKEPRLEAGTENNDLSEDKLVNTFFWTFFLGQGGIGLQADVFRYVLIMNPNWVGRLPVDFDTVVTKVSGKAKKLVGEKGAGNFHTQIPEEDIEQETKDALEPMYEALKGGEDEVDPRSKKELARDLIERFIVTDYKFIGFSDAVGTKKRITLSGDKSEDIDRSSRIRKKPDRLPSFMADSKMSIVVDFILRDKKLPVEELNHVLADLKKYVLIELSQTREENSPYNISEEARHALKRIMTQYNKAHPDTTIDIEQFTF